MLKLRLKRIGRKRQPFYRLVIMENTTRRDGRAIDQVGHYNVLNKKLFLNRSKIDKWLSVGAQPTRTTLYLLNKGNAQLS